LKMGVDGKKGIAKMPKKDETEDRSNIFLQKAKRAAGLEKKGREKGAMGMLSTPYPEKRK